MKAYYHNDMDGRCAASLVAFFTGNRNPVDYFEVDYISPLPIDSVRSAEVVFLVDYSLKKDTVWQLEKLIEIGCHIVWLDHHTSSLNLENEMVQLKDIEGIRRDKISGAALTYMYFTQSEYNSLPKYVRLVSDYDCWIYEFDPDTTYFKIGIETFPFDALDLVWFDLILQDRRGENDLINSIINIGKSIKSYIDKDNTMYRNQWAYETILEGHKCLVINRKSNSWIFGNKYNEYPVVMVWAFNGIKYSYSIYSSNPAIDCSKIAEKYGGGGHRGAAGFTSDELLFKKI